MNPLSKSKAKYIKSLQLKKNRLKEKRFIVEGEKSVLEFLNSEFKLEFIVGTEEFFSKNQIDLDHFRIINATQKELSGVGSLKSNNAVLAVVELPIQHELKADCNGIILALDGINDPGNLGTIIRTADWFGIESIIMNEDSVDVFNPKVVSSSKGSLSRIKVYQQRLSDFLANYKGEIIGADMTGISLSELNPLKNGVIVMGSESHGISKEVEKYLTQKATIPSLGQAESLNVGVATGIICNQLISKD